MRRLRGSWRWEGNVLQALFKVQDKQTSLGGAAVRVCPLPEAIGIAFPAGPHSAARPHALCAHRSQSLVQAPMVQSHAKIQGGTDSRED
ncbi:hypothetical protein QQF64_031741 [Cirrhinus molitorella]|uniref:Uncharacterized protein n=1 Tax=Cirrhinus molitorella TaxID=172907 RepID=A0ABR3MXT1_9TELE